MNLVSTLKRIDVFLGVSSESDIIAARHELTRICNDLLIKALMPQGTVYKSGSGRQMSENIDGAIDKFLNTPSIQKMSDAEQAIVFHPIADKFCEIYDRFDTNDDSSWGEYQRRTYGTLHRWLQSKYVELRQSFLDRLLAFAMRITFYVNYYSSKTDDERQDIIILSLVREYDAFVGIRRDYVLLFEENSFEDKFVAMCSNNEPTGDFARDFLYYSDLYPVSKLLIERAIVLLESRNEDKGKLVGFGLYYPPKVKALQEKVETIHHSQPRQFRDLFVLMVRKMVNRSPIANKQEVFQLIENKVFNKI